MPQVEIDWACDSERGYYNVQIRQKDALGEGHLWPLKTQVLLGYKSGPPERIAASLDGAMASVPKRWVRAVRITFSATTRTKPTENFCWMPRSQAVIVDELPRVSDPFLRSLLWGALWDNVRELRMAPLEYSELALRVLPSEQDAELAVSILGRLRTAFHRLFVRYTAHCDGGTIREPSHSGKSPRRRHPICGLLTSGSHSGGQPPPMDATR